jgi:hypothetical protein
MASSYTTNKDLEKPGNGDYVDTWNVPVNGDLNVLDYALGYAITFNATAGSQTLGTYDHSTKVLATYSYVPLIINITGAISANVTYTIPSGVGGQWIVYNQTTDATGGPWTVTFASGGGGLSQVISRLSPTVIYSDGANIRAVTQPVPGSNTQLIFNNSGAFGASSGMTWNGTTMTANAISSTTTLAATTNITAGGTITATGNITAFSDRSLKRDIQTIEHALDLIKSLRGVTFEMINTGQQGIGVIAQEVQEVVPQVVQDNNGILSVAYGNLAGILIEAVKELSARVEALETK